MAQAFVIQCKETISDNILLQHHVKILTVDLLAKHMNYVNVVYKIASKCSDIAVKDVKTLFYPKRRFCVLFLCLALACESSASISQKISFISKLLDVIRSDER